MDLNMFKKLWVPLLSLFILLLLPAIKNCSFVSKDNVQCKSKSAGSANSRKSSNSFGENQLRKMILDRPQMERFISSNDQLWTTISNLFEGELCNHPVSWDPKCPQPEDRYYVGQSFYPIPGRDICCIRLRKYDGANQLIEGELLWSSLIFEFHNIAEGERFYQVYLDAINDRLTREQYIEGMTRIEHISLGRTYSFYQNRWFPAMNKKNLETHSKYWRLNYKREYRDWINQFKDQSSYPYDNYGSYFDKVLVPYLKGSKDKKRT